MSLLKFCLLVLDALTKREDPQSTESTEIVFIFLNLLYLSEDSQTIGTNFGYTEKDKKLIMWVLSVLKKCHSTDDGVQRCEIEALNFMKYLWEDSETNLCIHKFTGSVILRHLDHRTSLRPSDYKNRAQIVMKILQNVTKASDRYLFQIAFYRNENDENFQSLLDKLQWILFFGLRVGDGKKFSSEWKGTLHICLDLLQRCSQHPGFLLDMVDDHRVTYAFIMVVKQKHCPAFNIFAIEIIREIHELNLSELQSDQNYLSFVKDYL